VSTIQDISRLSNGRKKGATAKKNGAQSMLGELLR
jgi:hypothetical protein